MPVELLADHVRRTPGVHGSEQLVAGGDELCALAGAGHFPEGGLAFGAEAEVFLGVEGAGHDGEAAVVHGSFADDGLQGFLQRFVHGFAAAACLLDQGKDCAGKQSCSQVVEAGLGAVGHHDEAGDVAELSLDEADFVQRRDRGGERGGVGVLAVLRVGSHLDLACLHVADDAVAQVADHEVVALGGHKQEGRGQVLGGAAHFRTEPLQKEGDLAKDIHLYVDAVIVMHDGVEVIRQIVAYALGNSFRSMVGKLGAACTVCEGADRATILMDGVGFVLAGKAEGHVRAALHCAMGYLPHYSSPQLLMELRSRENNSSGRDLATLATLMLSHLKNSVKLRPFRRMGL